MNERIIVEEKEKQEEDTYKSMRELSKYSKILSKTTKNRNTSKKVKNSKENIINKDKKPQKPESQRNYHYSMIFSTNHSDNKLINRKRKNKNIYTKKNKTEKNSFIYDYFFKNKNF